MALLGIKSAQLIHLCCAYQAFDLVTDHTLLEDAFCADALTAININKAAKSVKQIFFIDIIIGTGKLI